MTVNPKNYDESNLADVHESEASTEVDGLLSILKHSKNSGAIKDALNRLESLNDEKTVEPIIQMALDKGKPGGVRRTAIRVLGLMGNDKAVEPLIFMLNENGLQDDAARALGQLHAAKAVKLLVFLLGDEDVSQDVNQLVPKAIVEALGQIATEEAIAGLISEWGGSLAQKISTILENIGPQAVEPLVGALGSSNQAIRERAVDVLGEIGDESAVDPLLTILMNESEDEFFRAWHVAKALGKIGDYKAVEPLIELLSKHTEEVVTCEAAFALGDIGDHKAVAPLIAVLEDNKTTECAHLRIAAVKALGDLKDNEAVEPLLRVLRNPRDPATAYVPAALTNFDDDRIELPLLRHFDKKLQMEATTKLEQEDEWASLRKLIARLAKKTAL